MLTCIRQPSFSTSSFIRSLNIHDNQYPYQLFNLATVTKSCKSKKVAIIYRISLGKVDNVYMVYVKNV